MQPKISLVIVNWNSGTLLKDCLKSVSQSDFKEDYEIIVVDNFSSDGSELIVEDIESAHLIRAKSNLGFGKACNLGALQAKGDYLLFLNPDAAVTNDSLSKCLSFMEGSDNSVYGAIGVKLVDTNGHIAKSSCRLPTPSSMFFHSIGIDRLFPKAGYFMTDWDHKDSREVEHVIGAFYLIRQEVFEKLNGFDERFFVYLEDLDLSLRVKSLGYKIYYLAEAEAFHVGGGTSNKVKALRLFYSTRSRLLYVNKHFSFLASALIFVTTLFVEPIMRVLLSALKFEFAGVAETLKGYYYLYRWLPSLFKKNY